MLKKRVRRSALLTEILPPDFRLIKVPCVLIGNCKHFFCTPPHGPVLHSGWSHHLLGLCKALALRVHPAGWQSGLQVETRRKRYAPGQGKRSSARPATPHLQRPASSSRRPQPAELRLRAKHFERRGEIGGTQSSAKRCRNSATSQKNAAAGTRTERRGCEMHLFVRTPMGKTITIDVDRGGRHDRAHEGAGVPPRGHPA